MKWEWWKKWSWHILSQAHNSAICLEEMSKPLKVFLSRTVGLQYENRIQDLPERNWSANHSCTRFPYFQILYKQWQKGTGKSNIVPVSEHRLYKRKRSHGSTRQYLFIYLFAVYLRKLAVIWTTQRRMFGQFIGKVLSWDLPEETSVKICSLRS